MLIVPHVERRARAAKRRAVLARKRLLRTVRRPRWGGFRRMQPLSPLFGMDRGTPVDRIPIEDFLQRHADDIRGRVLEVGDDRYVTAYGNGQVTSVDILDVDTSNPRATVIADLGVPDSLPAGRFDCIIVCQTLQYVDPPATALANLHRALAPGGVLLVTVPTTSRMDPVPELAAVERWRFTARGIEAELARVFPREEVSVEQHGNLLTATAFLHGIAAEELTAAELRADDPFFPIVACARARRT